MAALPSSHPALSLRLTDPILTPLVSSPADLPVTSQQFISQQSLQAASLTTYATARRLGLGRPMRVMVETAGKGPIVLHSYLNPSQQRPRQVNTLDANGHNGEEGDDVDAGMSDILASTRGGLNDISSTSTADSGAHLSNGIISTNGITGVFTVEDDVGADGPNDVEDSEEDEQMSGLLIATVVAPSAEYAREARQAVGRLERVAGEFQREWARNSEDERRSPGA